MDTNSAEKVIKLPEIPQSRKPTWSLLDVGLALKCNVHTPSNHINTQVGWYKKTVIPPTESNIGRLSQENATEKLPETKVCFRLCLLILML